MKASVIIPCYNTARYVAQTLQSVFAQTYSDYEVVVVNDGSPDTPQLEAELAPWRDRITYLKSENQGLAAARNFGIRNSSGELLAFLDSDDYWHPEYLAIQVQALKNDPEADIVYPNAFIVNEGPSPSPDGLLRDRTPSRGPVNFISLVNQTCVVMVSSLMKRAAVERAGLLNGELRCCEDFDLWLRCLKTGSKIIYHDVPLVYYRVRGDSLSASETRMLKTRIQVIENAKATLPLTEAERQAADAAIVNDIARQQYAEAREQFARGNMGTVIAKLYEANTFYRSRRIHAMLVMLVMAPQLVQSAYNLRQRYLNGRTQKGRSGLERRQLAAWSAEHGQSQGFASGHDLSRARHPKQQGALAPVDNEFCT